MAKNPLTVATAIPDGKIRKFYEQVVVPALKYSGMSPERLQKLIELEKEMYVRSQFEKLFRELEDDLIEYLPPEAVEVDYSKPGALAKALETGGFEVMNAAGLDLGEIKFQEHRKVTRPVSLHKSWPNGIYLASLWPHSLIFGNKKFTDPLIAAKYAAGVTTGWLGDRSLVVIFEHEGNPYCLSMYAKLKVPGPDNPGLVKRRLARIAQFYRVAIGNSWSSFTRFVVTEQ